MTAKQLMLAFQVAFKRHEPYIRKATAASDVQYTTLVGGDFIVTVYWTDRRGVKGQYAKRFAREKIFTRISAGVRPLMTKRPCRYVDDLIMEVLEVRKGTDVQQQ